MKAWTWAAAAATADNCTRGSQISQRNSPAEPGKFPLSFLISTNWYAKLLDLEKTGGGRWGRTVRQVVLSVVGIVMLTCTLALLQSMRNGQGICLDSQMRFMGFPPRGSEQRDGSSGGSVALTEAEEIAPNDEVWLLKQERENGTTSCHESITFQTLVFGLELPSKGNNVRLATNQYHRFVVVSYTADGTRRCSGGDFYETDLSGVKWKSRPPIKDLGDGSYLLSLRLGHLMAGVYTLKVILLFFNLHGMDMLPQPWVQAREVFHIQIEFVNPSSESTFSPPINHRGGLPACTKEDFKLRAWQGRWTRGKTNETCRVDPFGRFKCLDPGEPCEKPWCEGPVGSLESNGWVYSAHCAFRIFTKDEAWGCLKGRWLFFWGDSNHQDTIRNILNFILGREDSGIERTFQSTFSNPQNSSEELKITCIFNGHYLEHDNNLGLYSLSDVNYRKTIKSFFVPSKAVRPDTIILNSGLHDGNFWPTSALFAQGARNASKFWEDIWRNTSPDNSSRPQVVFRTTVAPAGESRNMPANPQKMDAYNSILGEELVSTFGKDVLKIVDAYDMTFPWHYDNSYSDGGHYGRPPHIQSTHGYFVDVMLAHVLLNAICPA